MNISSEKLCSICGKTHSIFISCPHLMEPPVVSGTLGASEPVYTPLSEPTPPIMLPITDSNRWVKTLTEVEYNALLDRLAALERWRAEMDGGK